MSFCWFAPSIRKPLIMFCYVTFHFVEASLLCFIGWFVPSSQTFYLCASTVCKRLEQGLENGLQGVLVCVFTYHFGMLVVGCVCNPFFLSLANQGAYFNSLLNIR